MYDAVNNIGFLANVINITLHILRVILYSFTWILSWSNIIFKRGVNARGSDNESVNPSDTMKRFLSFVFIYFAVHR